MGMHRVPDDDQLSAAWDDEWRNAVMPQCLNAVRSEVEPKTFEAFELLACRELPAAEVAERLGMTPNALFGAKRRVLRRARELLGQIEDHWSGLRQIPRPTSQVESEAFGSSRRQARTRMSICPSEEQLERCFTRAAPGGDSVDLEAHLADCPRCRTWLDEDRADHALLGRVQRVMAAAPLHVEASADPGNVSEFRIIRPIGQGGMGRLFEAEQLEPRRSRATLRVARSERCDNGRGAERPRARPA